MERMILSNCVQLQHHVSKTTVHKKKKTLKIYYTHEVSAIEESRSHIVINALFLHLIDTLF